MNSMSKITAAVATTLALCGAAMAQSNSPSYEGGSSVATPDNTGGTVSTPPSSMPAEQAPASQDSTSGTTTTFSPASNVSGSGSQPYASNTVIPTREEVRRETHRMVHNNEIPLGTNSTNAFDLTQGVPGGKSPVFSQRH